MSRFHREIDYSTGGRMLKYGELDLGDVIYCTQQGEEILHLSNMHSTICFDNEMKAFDMGAHLPNGACRICVARDMA